MPHTSLLYLQYYVYSVCSLTVRASTKICVDRFVIQQWKGPVLYECSHVSALSCLHADVIELCLSQQSEESLARSQSRHTQHQHCSQFSLCSPHYLCSTDLLLSHPFPFLSLQ